MRHAVAAGLPDSPAAASPTITVRPGSLSTNVVWTTLATVAYAVCQWGTLVAFAKLGTPEALGQFAFALAVSAPVMMFLQFQLRTVLVTDSAGRFAFADYLCLRVSTSLVGLAIVVGFVALTTSSVATVIVAAIVTLVKVLDGISDIFFGAWQKRERMDVPARFLLINGILSLVFLTAALWAGASVVGALAGSLAGSAVALAAVVALTWSRTTESFLPAVSIAGRLRPLVLLSLPLGMVMALISLTSNIPRYYIQNYFGERELGIFAALTYVTAAGTTLISAVGHSLTPQMARAFDRGDTGQFISLMARLTAVAATVGAAGVAVAALAAEPLLRLAYGDVYAEASSVFLRAMVLGTVMYLAAAVGFGMSAAKYFRAQVPIFGVVIVSLVAASSVWIPAGGLHGAVSALIVGSMVQLTLGGAVLFHAVRARRDASVTSW